MPEDKYPSQLAERFIVRLPDGMRDRIAAEAKKNNRSMNAEVVARLEESFTLGAELRQATANHERLEARMTELEEKTNRALALVTKGKK